MEPSAVATFALTAGQMRYEPIYVTTPLTIDQIACEVTSAGAGGTTIRMGIFTADTDLQPTGLVVDGGTVAADGATGMRSVSVSVTLTPGRYLMALNTDSTATMRSLRGGSMLSGFGTTLGTSPWINLVVTLAYAAFSGPGTAWTAPAASSAPPNHILVVRVV